MDPSRARFASIAALVASAAVAIAAAVDVAQRGDLRTVTLVGLAAGFLGVVVSAVRLRKEAASRSRRPAS